MNIGDIVFMPAAKGSAKYWIGKIASDYYYYRSDNEVSEYPHRRKVEWLKSISKADISKQFSGTLTNTSAVININNYADEIELLLKAGVAFVSGNISSDETAENPVVFGIERHLEHFLVDNWSGTELGKNYDIYKDENGSGEQYQTDAGIIDILAQSKNGKDLLVIELKKGRTSDIVVGQTLRYIGFVKGELASEEQSVRGCIIALEDDKNLSYALNALPNGLIDFYRYKVEFTLLKK